MKLIGAIIIAVLAAIAGALVAPSLDKADKVLRCDSEDPPMECDLKRGRDGK